MGNAIFRKLKGAGITPERCIIVAASYTGSENIVTDLANAKAEVDKLFNPNWIDSPCEDEGAHEVYTIRNESDMADFITTYGAIDSRIVPFVTKQVLGEGEFAPVRTSDYTLDRAAGTITFTDALDATDVVKATVMGNIKGASAFEPGGDIGLTENKEFVYGTIEEFYKYTRYEGVDPTFSFQVFLDIGTEWNQWPGEQVEKMVYGDEYTAAAAGASGTVFSSQATWNELSKNADPFFLLAAYINEDDTTGEMKTMSWFFHGCEVDALPLVEGFGDAGGSAPKKTFKGKASAVYTAAFISP